MKAFLYILALLVWFFLILPIFAQTGSEAGRLIIRNYSPKEYGAGPQNFAIRQDSRGILYIANQNTISLLEFDGVTWRHIESPSESFITALAIDNNNRIYLGSPGEIGVLAPDSTGAPRFQSLLPHVKPEDRHFLWVLSVHVTQQGVYFNAGERLFRWQSGTLKTWRPRTSFEFAALVDDHFYIYQDHMGLMEVVGDSLRLVAGGEKFADMPVGAMFPFYYRGRKSILLGIGGEGLFIYDDEFLQPLPGEAGNFVRQYGIRCSAALDDSTFTIASKETGMMIFDANGKILHILDENTGLASNTVYEITSDREGGLWMATLRGISRLNSFRPVITVFDRLKGVKGIVGGQPVRYKGILYIRTTEGVYFLDRRRSSFVPVAGLEGELWNLFEHNDSLYAARESLRIITGSGSRVIKQLEGKALTVIPSSFDVNRFYLGFDNGFRIMTREKNVWNDEKPVKDIHQRITRGVAENPNGDVWLGLQSAGIIRLGFSSNPVNPEVQYYGPEAGLPLGDLRVCKTSRGVRFLCDNRIYLFDDITQRISQDTILGKPLGDSLQSVALLAEDHLGNIWLSVREGLNYYLNVLRRQPNGDFFLERKPFLNVPSTGIWMIFPEENGIVWFGGEEGLYRYDDNAPKVEMADFPALVRRVIVNNDSIIYHGEHRAVLNNEPVSLKLTYTSRSLRFEVAATSFKKPPANKYQFQLEGFDKDWLPWASETQKDYTNIPEGSYTFRVRAKNIYEQQSSEGVFQFTILPPWYRSWWAYLLYGLLFSGCFGLTVYGYNKWRTGQLQGRTRELEATVAARTEELAEKNIELQELNATKSRFFANISHEFRTPLTLILGQIDSVLPDLKEKRNIQRLQMAHRNAVQLQRLINQLLDLSKFDAHQMQLHAAEQNIVPLLKKYTGSFESFADIRNITLQFEQSSDVIKVFIDRSMIEKIMYNLLSNALKFTPKGGTVLVKVEYHDLSGHREAAIMVRDSGVGIPAERLPHIFDRFFQVDSTITREFEGTGIGLALTKELVQLHGGGISVESTEGFGTTFTVRLPLGKAHLKPEQIAEADAGYWMLDTGYSILDTGHSKIDTPLNVADAAPTDPTSSDKHPASSIQHPASSDPNPKSEIRNSKSKKSEIVLIVEDNPDMRAYIRDTLTGSYRILEAPHGEAGFALAQEHIPDLIITDVMMPKVDGYALTRMLRQDLITSHIPIIMLTAKAEDSDKFEGLETGVDVFLTKPFSTKELEIRVRKLIERYRLLREQTGVKAIMTPAEVAVSSLDQQFLQRLQEVIEANIENEAFSVDELALQTGVSKRQLQRKVKALTDLSPVQCLRSMRLHRARQLLEKGAGNVTEVCFRVGYGDVSAFSKAFSEAFGQPPSAFIGRKE